MLVAAVTETKTAKSAVKTKTNQTIIASGDVSGTTKSVEVYSQGQKLMGSNATNISDLPEGTYLLKITSTPSKKITSK